MTTTIASTRRIAVREGLLTDPLTDLQQVRLLGSRCLSCGEVSLGQRRACPNCGGDAIRDIALSDRGVLWTFTIVHHRPPGNYKGPEPFAPFALGLIELPEGVRVLSPIHGDLDDLKIGVAMCFKPYIRSDEASEVVVFAFEAAGASHE